MGFNFAARVAGYKPANSAIRVENTMLASKTQI